MNRTDSLVAMSKIQSGESSLKAANHRYSVVQRGAAIALGRSPLVGRPWPFCGIPITKWVVVLTQALHTGQGALQTPQFCNIQRASSNFKTEHLKRQPSMNPTGHALFPTISVLVFLVCMCVCIYIYIIYTYVYNVSYLPWSSSLLTFEAISLTQPQAYGPSDPS